MIAAEGPLKGLDLAKVRDPRWRIQHLYKIVNDDGTQIQFRPNEEQLNFFDNLANRNLVLKARQLGFTTFIAILALDQCLFNGNFTAGIIAHTKDDAGKIFRNKVLKVYESMPRWVQAFTQVSSQTAEGIVFANGSSITVSSSVRSGTVQFLHVSEMGKIARKYPEKAREIVTGSFEAVPKSGIIVVESTAEGKSGWFYDSCMQALRRAQQQAHETQLDFKLHFYPWYSKASYTLDATHVIFTDSQIKYFRELELKLQLRLSKDQRAWYVVKQRTLGDDMKREYPSTPEEAFEGSLEGVIYGPEMAALRLLGRIGKVPVRQGIRINSFWDLGVNDKNAIWLHQRVGAMNRFPRYMQDSNRGMRYYHDELEKWRKEVGGIWGKHYLPHDGDQRIQGYEVTTRKQILEDLGFRDIVIIPRIPNLLDGIEATRKILPECEFDEEGCAEGIECLDNYSREWDEDLGQWSRMPRHDKFSNGADAFRQFAQSNFDKDSTPSPLASSALHDTHYARGAY